MAFVAKKIFLTKGVGKHRERLSSFELALRNAGIAACNIVRVSSIFPPNCKLISRSEGLKHIKPGQVAFTVISENSTKEPHRLIAASIGLALPSDKTMYGYLSEHHSFGESEEIAGEYAEELAAEMLATTLNVEFDPDLSWDEKKELNVSVSPRIPTEISGEPAGPTVADTSGRHRMHSFNHSHVLLSNKVHV